MAEERLEQLIEKLRSGQTLEDRLEVATKLGKLGDERAIPVLIEILEKDENDAEMIDGSWSEPSKAHYLYMIADIGGEQAKDYLFGLFRGKYTSGCSFWATFKGITRFCKEDNAVEIADFIIETFNEGEGWVRERINEFFHFYGKDLVRYEDARKKLQAYSKEKDNTLNHNVEIAIRVKLTEDLRSAIYHSDDLDIIVTASDELCDRGYPWHAANELHDVLHYLLYDTKYMGLKRKSVECLKRSKVVLYPQARKRLWDYVNDSYLQAEDMPFREEVKKMLMERDASGNNRPDVSYVTVKL